MHKAIAILNFFMDQVDFEKDILEVKTNNGWCPLLLAVRSESIDIARYLLEKVVDVNTQSKNVCNCLHIAIQLKS